MKQAQRILLGAAIILVLASVLLIIVWQPSVIRKVTFPVHEAAYKSWEDILSHPQPISIRTYSTGIMQTDLSGIMNLEHKKAQRFEDEVVEIPVNVSIIQHQQLGSYLIDAGLDESYVHNPHGTIRGLLVEQYLGKGSQEPNTHIASILQ